MTVLFLLALAGSAPSPDSPPVYPPAVAVLPKETKVPQPKVVVKRNNRPGATHFPNPHRRFTRKG